MHLVPGDFERKQTLVNAERYTTPELREYERKVLDADERIADIERRLFSELRQRHGSADLAGNESDRFPGAALELPSLCLDRRQSASFCSCFVPK